MEEYFETKNQAKASLRYSNIILQKNTIITVAYIRSAKEIIVTKDKHGILALIQIDSSHIPCAF